MTTPSRLTDYRIRAKWVAFNEALFDERFQSSQSAEASHLMVKVWNEYFCWPEGFVLQLRALQGSPRRWVLRETVG